MTGRMAKFDAYIICGTPRTGSTLLCGLLAAAGAGNPDSYFASRFMADWAREWGLGTMGPADVDAAYLAAAMSAGRGGTAIFGLRLMRENLEDLSAILDRLSPGHTSDAARIAAAFGRTLFIHISRKDKLAQAVSLVKAQQTGLWHVAPDGSEIERLGPPADPEYDFRRIRAEVRTLEAYDAAWESWFAAQGISPLRVSYDRLSAEPAAVPREIREALGLEPPTADTTKPGITRMADAISAEWVKQYEIDSRAGT